VNENQVPYLTESAGTKTILALVEDPDPERADFQAAKKECGVSGTHGHRESAYVLKPEDPRTSLH
jgi:hypothetical protein